MNKNLRKIIFTITAFTFITLLSSCTNSKTPEPSNEKTTSIQKNSNSDNTSSANNNTLNTNSSNEKIHTSNPSTPNKSINNINSTKKTNITPSKNNNSKSSQKDQPKKIKGKKQSYLNKLQSTKNNLDKRLKKKYAGTTLEMRQAAEEEYMTWDKHLNEIYSELKKDLSKDTMEKLKKEETQWISYRDREAKKDADSFKGGSFMPVQNLLSLGDLTKQRCYELVNKYMD
ncbi:MULTISPECIES: lysozyme inhibitor LprI family protein [Clostridium]|uniref:Lipoprotein, putative n=1 Tax=Clostridium novyi (strain NT) TaxID=386415 RepID=A0PY12_CLONN|nr:MULTISPECIES: lysozyme inhibitor LprI family protein [Clostridium]ABK61863.1 lipoprotein, putative [Clostridium novyi NT]KEH87274.1 hypothetical protein Z966_11685 [Clostridium novyi A str. NCTC 538]KEH93311.1 hypothetical protein Z963_02105 [Clostridium botulinum C/D str. It1]